MQPMTRRLAVLATVAVVSVPAVPPNAHSQSPAADALIGTWQLDAAKSKYSPGPGPKSETRVYRLVEGGIKAVITRTHRDGQVETIEYGANQDSINHVIGTPDYDAVTLKKVDAFISEATLSHAGRLFGTARRVIAKDGMSMVITFRQDAQPPITNVAVYNKVVP
jgi:hypothetical protein